MWGRGDEVQVKLMRVCLGESFIVCVVTVLELLGHG